MKVPTGFLPTTSEEVNPEGLSETAFFVELTEAYETLPVTLFTDRHGTNFFVLEQDGKRFVLPVRTD